MRAGSANHPGVARHGDGALQGPSRVPDDRQDAEVLRIRLPGEFNSLYLGV